MSFVLHPKLDADTFLVGELPISKLLMMNDSRFLWCIVVPRVDDCREMHHLPTEHRHQVAEEVNTVAAALEQISRADKMNVAALGNQVPQLHWHVIARFESDVAWPGPVWGVGDAEGYGVTAYETELKRLRAALGDSLI